MDSKIRKAIENDKDTIVDLHIWQVGPGYNSVIVLIASTTPKTTSQYKAMLEQIGHIAHTTVEVHQVEKVV